MTQTTDILKRIRTVIGIGNVESNHVFFDIGEPYYCNGIYIDRVHSGRYYVGYCLVPWYAFARPNEGKAFSAAYSERLQGAARSFAADKINPHAAHEITAALIEQQLLPDLGASYKPRDFLQKFFLARPNAYLGAPYLRLCHLADYMMTAFVAQEESLARDCAETLVQFDPNIPHSFEAIALANDFLCLLGRNDEVLSGKIEARVKSYKESMKFVGS